MWCEKGVVVAETITIKVSDNEEHNCPIQVPPSAVDDATKRSSGPKTY